MKKKSLTVLFTFCIFLTGIIGIKAYYTSITFTPTSVYFEIDNTPNPANLTMNCSYSSKNVHGALETRNSFTSDYRTTLNNTMSTRTSDWKSYYATMTPSVNGSIYNTVTRYY